MTTTLNDMGLPVRIWSMPVEIPRRFRSSRTRCITRTSPSSRIVSAGSSCRCTVSSSMPLWFRRQVQSRPLFLGKLRPCGHALLGPARAAARGPAFMREAYSHEVVSHGFWPGSAPVLEPAFYAYAVPEPAGLKNAHVEPDAAFYHSTLNEFLLPYEAVRAERSPDGAIARSSRARTTLRRRSGAGIALRWSHRRHLRCVRQCTRTPWRNTSYRHCRFQWPIFVPVPACQLLITSAGVERDAQWKSVRLTSTDC